MKPTKQKTEWESRPRHYGKSTFVKDSFIAECKAGNSVEIHARDYVCMSRKRYEELSTQRQQLKDILEKHKDKTFGTYDYDGIAVEVIKLVTKDRLIDLLVGFET